MSGILPAERALRITFLAPVELRCSTQGCRRDGRSAAGFTMPFDDSAGMVQVARSTPEDGHELTTAVEEAPGPGRPACAPRTHRAQGRPGVFADVDRPRAPTKRAAKKD